MTKLIQTLKWLLPKFVTYNHLYATNRFIELSFSITLSCLMVFFLSSDFIVFSIPSPTWCRLYVVLISLMLALHYDWTGVNKDD